MRRAGQSYGNRSLAALGTLVVATQAFHPRALLPLEAGQTAAWLLVLSATATAALFMWPTLSVLRRIPGGALVELGQAAIGRGGAALLAVLWSGSIVFAGGIILRETSEMAISAAFPHTPQTFATTAMLLAAFYVGYGDAPSVVRHGRILLPMLLVAVALVLVGTTGWGELGYLKPFWGPGPVKLLMNVPAAGILVGPAMFCSCLADQVEDRKGLLRWSLVAVAAGGATLAIVRVVLGMVFAFPVGVRIPYPLHEAARLILGGRYFERLEGIWIFTWVTCTVVMLGTMLHAAARISARAFSIPGYRTAVPGYATMFLTMAFFPPDLATSIRWADRSAGAFFVLWLVVPALLAGIAAFRMRGRSA